MNRSLLVGCVVLSVVAGSAAVYTRFAAALAAPAAPTAPSAQSGVAPPLRALPSAIEAGAGAPPNPELERLEHRRRLYETVESLIDGSEFDLARQWLDEGLARYGEDAAPEWRDLEQSYRLMADCLQNPGDPQPRIRARAFLRVSEARPLIPKLSAACVNQ